MYALISEEGMEEHICPSGHQIQTHLQQITWSDKNVEKSTNEEL